MKTTENEKALGNHKIRKLGKIGKRTCEVMMILLGIFQLLIAGAALLPMPHRGGGATTEYGYAFNDVALSVKLGIVIIAATFFVAPWILLILTRKIFAQFAEGSILNDLLAKSMLWLSSICLLTGLLKLSEGVFSLLKPSFNQNILLSSTENKVVKSYDLSAFVSFAEWLLLGMILLGLYWGVRQAISIKAENDLTI